MDNLLVGIGEDKVKQFLRTLTNQEKIELIEEVKTMIQLRSLDIDTIKTNDRKPSVDFTFMEEYG